MSLTQLGLQHGASIFQFEDRLVRGTIYTYHINNVLTHPNTSLESR
jgi:hypothetical protein